MPAVKEKPRLKEKYERDVVPALREEFKYDNPMQVPRLVEDRGEHWDW